MKAGYRHATAAVQFGGVDAVRRVSMGKPDGMDSRTWTEAPILEVCRGAGLLVPRLLSENPMTGMQTLERLPGEPLEAEHPHGSPVPKPVIVAVARLLTRLRAIDRARLPPLPPSWPADGDASTFLRARVNHTEALLKRYWAEHGERLVKVGVSPAEIRQVREMLPLSPCKFVLCHGDLNRTNILWNGRSLSVVDWELATYGDPAFEVAVHLHRCGYARSDGQLLRTQLVHEYPEAVRSDALDAHLDHERLRSRLVDAVRYRAQVLSSGRDPDLIRALSERYTTKLRSSAGREACMSPREVAGILFDVG